MLRHEERGGVYGARPHAPALVQTWHNIAKASGHRQHPRSTYQAGLRRSVASDVPCWCTRLRPHYIARHTSHRFLTRVIPYLPPTAHVLYCFASFSGLREQDSDGLSYCLCLALVQFAMVSFTLAEESPIKVDDRLRGDEGSALRAMSGTISPSYARVSDADSSCTVGGALLPASYNVL